ncbi:MAG: transglycosylase SLT domain-containing protein [Spirochaetales bacterium]|nr:transglycosylase SLT domain-containing protein [Spirochaetales bacterium]
MLGALFLTACSVPEKAGTASSADAVLSLYRTPELKASVLEYFSRLTENRAIAKTILAECDRLNLPPSLAFSLAWNESKFNPLAFNRNPDSVDRGLFQLNSKTFRLSREAVYDLKTNTRHGLAFFKKIYDRTGNIADALAYYNSGIANADSPRLPASTKDYIQHILRDRQALDHGVMAWLFFSQQTMLASR